MRRRTGFDVVVRALILERSDGCCEVCGRLAVFGVGQAHHRRPRGAGGSKRTDTNLPSNALWLCSGPDGCHEHVESHRALAYDNGWLVHQTASPRDVAVLRRNSWVILDDLGGFELVRNVMCDNGKSPDEGVEWKDPAQRELPGGGRTFTRGTTE